MASGADQSNELNMVDRDDGNIAPDFPQYILKDWLYN